MTRILFQRQLELPVDIAWELLTSPLRMNEWSVAPVTAAAGSDPRVPGGERVVHVRKFGVRLDLHEVTIMAERPHMYRYCVRPNAVVRKHVAEQRLRTGTDCVVLEWEVDIRSWLPGLMPLLVRSMRAQLEGSLDRLEAVARQISSEAPGQAESHVARTPGSPGTGGMCGGAEVR